MTELRQLQHWLLARLARPDLILLPADASLLEIPPGAHAPRLDIYIQAYRLRLLDCLRADFPGLARLLGADLFDLLAEGYIRQRPPSSPSLYDLGHGFAGFLRRSQRSRMQPGQPLAARQALRLAWELARFERAWLEISRAPGLENAAMPQPSGPFCNPASRLWLPATTRPLLLLHPLEKLQALLRGDAVVPTAGVPPNRPHYILLTRHDFVLSAREIEDWAYFTLRAAAGRPRALHDCAAFAAQRLRQDPATLLARLMLWVPLAQQAGWLSLEN